MGKINQVLVHQPDDAWFCELQRALRGSAYQLWTGSSLEASLVLLRSKPVDILVIGPLSPAEEDPEILSLLRTRTKNPWVVALVDTQDTTRCDTFEKLEKLDIFSADTPVEEVAWKLLRGPTTAPALTPHGRVSRSEVEALEAYVEANPDAKEGDWLLGFARYRRREFAAALRHFLEVVRRDPEHHRARYYLGSCHYRLGRSQPAIECWKTVALAIPETAEGRRAAQHVAKAARDTDTMSREYIRNLVHGGSAQAR